MSETKTPGDKKLSVSKLSLKPRTETGVVRQSFSHGRSKQVVVEVKKRRAPGGEPKAEAAPAVEIKKPVAKSKAGATAAPAATPAAPKSGVVLRTLTEEERTARASALADSRVREAEERKIAEEEARRRASRETTDRVEREAAEGRKRDEDQRHKREEETKRNADDVAKKRFGEAERPAGRLTLEAEDDEAPRSRRPGAGPAPGQRPPRVPRRASAPKNNAAVSLWSPRCAPTKCANGQWRRSAAAPSA
jgi:translation initiation factor IF-2